MDRNEAGSGVREAGGTAVSRRSANRHSVFYSKDEKEMKRRTSKPLSYRKRQFVHNAESLSRNIRYTAVDKV